MPKPFYRIIDFPVSKSKTGALTMFQSHKRKSGSIPFPMRKVLAITGMRGKAARGAHTHKITQQVLVCVQGGCIIDLDNGTDKKSILLNRPNQGVVLYPYVWHVMRDFKPNSVLLVLADQEYDEKEYIRDYEKFLSYVRSSGKNSNRKK